MNKTGVVLDGRVSIEMHISSTLVISNFSFKVIRELKAVHGS
jgi:hypothetical protein